MVVVWFAPHLPGGKKVAKSFTATAAFLIIRERSLWVAARAPKNNLAFLLYRGGYQYFTTDTAAKNKPLRAEQ